VYFVLVQVIGVVVVVLHFLCLVFGRLDLVHQLLLLALPFARPGGLVLLIKGQRAEEELAEASVVIAKQQAAHEQTVATPTGRIVVLRRKPASPRG
jgi:hypothetical protein